MSQKQCKIYIDDTPFQFQVEGDFFWGNDEVLYAKNSSVLDNVSWQNKGYDIVKAFTNEEFVTLKHSVKYNIWKAIQSTGVLVAFEKFELEKYHEYVVTNEQHLQVINVTRNLSVEDLNFNINLLVERFGEILSCKLTSWVEEIRKSHIQIRISRPNSLDINPPHRDGYFSYWNDIINIWVPISGCNAHTSLPLVPGSHLISEKNVLRTSSKGAKINGNVYNVPCILETNEGSFKMCRPNPKEGEALLFTPYLIHGAAVNQSENNTRISLELRFPKLNA
mgnify:CR=1 FL=1